jgi:hypothetical protein
MHLTRGFIAFLILICIGLVVHADVPTVEVGRGKFVAAQMPRLIGFQLLTISTNALTLALSTNFSAVIWLPQKVTLDRTSPPEDSLTPLGPRSRSLHLLDFRYQPTFDSLGLEK